MFMPISDTHFLKVSAHAPLKVVIKSSFRGKKGQNLEFLRQFFQSKTEYCNQKVWRVSEKFGAVTPCSVTYLGEVGA